MLKRLLKALPLSGVVAIVGIIVSFFQFTHEFEEDIGLGLLFKLVTIANILNIGGLLVLGAIAGGIPVPLPGGDPLPAFREAFLILAGVVSLMLSGPGKYALRDWMDKRPGN